MGFKDILRKIGEKQKEKKELFRQAENKLRINQTLEDRQKSANERELERFHKEEREEQIKEALMEVRQERENDIRLNHNPLDVENITKEGDFQILKQKSIFAKKSNMFVDQPFIHKSNNNLLKSGNNFKL